MQLFELGLFAAAYRDLGLGGSRDGSRSAQGRAGINELTAASTKQG
jgi:hypothetical protein